MEIQSLIELNFHIEVQHWHLHVDSIVFETVYEILNEPQNIHKKRTCSLGELPPVLILPPQTDTCDNSPQGVPARLTASVLADLEAARTHMVQDSFSSTT